MTGQRVVEPGVGILDVWSIPPTEELLLTILRDLFEQVSKEHNENNLLPAWLAPLTLPLGAGLIIFHTALHLVIDADYLARGKLPPERARSAH